jgi:CubicO group peptidase (beta-lactamase class C family)
MFYGAALKTTLGENYFYTDATAILLGELIRRVAGA